MLNKKSLIIGISSITVTTLLAVSSIVFANQFSLRSKAGIGNNGNYSLNLLSLNGSNKTISTSDNNQISFDLSEYNSGFSVGGYLRNTVALSGIQNITIGFSNESDQLTVSYGWENQRYIVLNQVISGTSNVYTFDDEAPSFFFINNSGDHLVTITSFAVTYSCSETDVPEARKNALGCRCSNGSLIIWNNRTMSDTTAISKSWVQKDAQGHQMYNFNYDYGDNTSYKYYYITGEKNAKVTFMMEGDCILHFDFQYRKVMLSDVIQVTYNNKPFDLDSSYKMYFKTGDEIVFDYSGHETYDSNYHTIYSNFYIHLRLVLSSR